MLAPVALSKFALTSFKLSDKAFCEFKVIIIAKMHKIIPAIAWPLLAFFTNATIYNNDPINPNTNEILFIIGIKDVQIPIINKNILKIINRFFNICIPLK